MRQSKLNKVLLAEDEESLRQMLKMNLELEGYHVTEAADGKTAIQCFESEKFDIAILDVMMPEIDGYEVCKRIRLHDNNIPVLFLTARDNPEDRVHGLELGADDYLGKPFNLKEFLLRVAALTRRQKTADKEMVDIAFGDNKVSFKTFEAVNFNGDKITLSSKEALLLKLLCEEEGKVVSRTEIIDMVWGVNQIPTTRTVDNFIVQLRKYFEKDPKNPVHLVSVHGVGYKFVKTTT